MFPSGSSETRRIRKQTDKEANKEDWTIDQGGSSGVLEMVLTHIIIKLIEFNIRRCRKKIQIQYYPFASFELEPILIFIVSMRYQ